MTDLRIRAEQPGEDTTIGSTHLHAFHEHRYQERLVALHRRHSDFDPDLSLVAEYRQRLIAHALFMPHHLRLLGTDIQAVNLVSIAVDPEFQGQGFGAHLIATGHDLAQAKGYRLSFVIGHPNYYNRFGYKQHAFGTSTIDVPVTMLRPGPLVARSVREDDIPALRWLWSREEDRVDFALDPGGHLSDWVSPNPNIQSIVYVHKHEVVGYTRHHITHIQRPHIFFARDYETAGAMASSLAEQAATHEPIHSIQLPLHPASASAAAFGTPHCASWGSAMGLSLGDSLFDDYYSQVQAGARPPGRIIWPAEFEAE